MKSRLEQKNQAIELRKSGLSYGEIQKTIKVSKGLLSGWLQNLELSDAQKIALKKHGEDVQNRGRLRAAITNKYKRAARENSALESAKKKFAKLKNEPAFLVGISLYWAHGSKKGSRFQFISSDRNMIAFMLGWIEKYFHVEKGEIEQRLLAKKLGAGGSVTLSLSGIEHLYTVNAWQKLVIEYLNKQK